MNITFITGNQNKADYLAKWLGQPVPHHKLDLPEVQSLDLREIVEQKAKAAYKLLQSPVLVEDVSLQCHALGQLPGPFIKWFLQELGDEGVCKMLNQYSDRSATASICYAVYDGQQFSVFANSMTGHIATEPRGGNGFGWDTIFIKDGWQKTRAELTGDDEQATSMRKQPLAELAEYLAKT